MTTRTPKKAKAASSRSGVKPRNRLESVDEGTVTEKERQAVVALLESSLNHYLDEINSVYLDKAEDDRWWHPVGSLRNDKNKPYELMNDTDLARVVQRSRRHEKKNPYAQNIFRNRVNYIIGKGCHYEFRKGTTVDSDSESTPAYVKDVEKFVRRWMLINNWVFLHQEIVKRTDRDGDTILRLYPRPNGQSILRVVEPTQVRTPTMPPSLVNDKNVSMGIRFDPRDASRPVGYYIHYGPDPDDYEYVEAEDIIHIKGNVDMNSVRGLPFTHAAFEDLDRAERLKRNMAIVTTIQASIAMIRKHPEGVKPEHVKKFLDGRSVATTSRSFLNDFERFELAGEPRIVDATKGYDYEFPSTGIDSSKMVTTLGGILRAICSAVIMPEFMITSDASNANYSSSMVSEAPTVREFEKAQGFYSYWFNMIIGRAIMRAINAGELSIPMDLPSGILGDEGVRLLEEVIIVDIKMPVVRNREALKETQRRKVLFDDKILSRQDWTEQEELDYDLQQKQIKEDEKLNPPPAPLEAFELGSDGRPPAGGKMGRTPTGQRVTGGARRPKPSASKPRPSSA